MNYLKSILIIFALISLSACNNPDNKQIENNTNNIKEEIEAVKNVMKAYKDTIQNLSTAGLTELFTKDSEVFESGGVEGSFEHYLEHHLAPELNFFESFKFTDYKIDVKIDSPYAFTTETYVYHIKIKPDEEKNIEAKTISRKGVATSVLKKIDGKWKILKTHTSARNTK
ncbi:MAG: nuclear transport factor 2 family protein [Bacteroidales bacterium]|nr:nuclear transport factor 2 family protein [Bacteroidales bacterium]